MGETMLRGHVLDGAGDDPRLTRLAPMTRLSLRLPEDAALPASAVLGLTLPDQPCRAARGEHCSALWLGPGEWLILAPETPDGLMAGLSEEFDRTPHSLADVSHRQVAIAVAGTSAAAMLNAGCPLDLDLDVFPVDACTRTLFGKAGIVLWRTGPDRFHLEVWRSFAPYVWDLLGVVGREYRQ